MNQSSKKLLKCTSGSWFLLLVVVLLCIQCTDPKLSTPEPLPQTETCKNTFEPHKALSTTSGHQGHGGETAEEVEEELGLPQLLSKTDLYENIAEKIVHKAIVEFRPHYQLWSDGLAKKRWVYIPECDTIDTTNMNSWSLPIGTRLFKEFSLDGKRIETRLIERVGPEPHDFLYASYVWNEAESEATMAPGAGVTNVSGTFHDIPSEDACRRCHGSNAKKGGMPSRALGFSALQLAHADSPLNLDDLVANQRLSDTPLAPPKIPGTATEQAALGYLHANCGACHNNSVDGIPQVNLNFWLETNHQSVEETGAYKTAIAQANQLFNDQHVKGRVVAGNPEESSVFYRINQRGNLGQMPPLGTERPDTAGIAMIRAWIEGLD